MVTEEKKITLKDGSIATIRSPIIEDGKELLNFIRKSAGETHYLLSDPSDFSMSIEDEEKWIERQLKSNDCTLLVIVDGKIIGDSGISFNRHKKDRHRCNVGITILKDYWNKGIGNILFDEMIVIAKNTEGITQMELGVIEDNERAIHLYTKKGFVKTGVIPRAIRLDDGTYYDEIYMVKYLD